jgi:hypothetical protein
LFSHIELYQHIDTRLLIRAISEFSSVEMIDILDMTDPVIEDTMRLLSEGSLDPTTSIVSADDDMLYSEHIYGIGEHAEHIHISMDDHIGDISLDEYFSRLCSYYLVGGDATIWTTDPKKWWSLSVCEFCEEFWIIFEILRDPLLIVLEDGSVEISHSLSYYTRIATFHTSESITREIWSRELRMDIIDRTTVLTEADRDSISVSGILTLTWEYDTLSCDRHLMDESLITKCIDDTIERREIHMSTRDERFFEIRKSHTRRLLEFLYEAATRHGDTRSRHMGSY